MELWGVWVHYLEPIRFSATKRSGGLKRSRVEGASGRRQERLAVVKGMLCKGRVKGAKEWEEKGC